MPEPILIPSGLRFLDHLGMPRATEHHVILVDDGALHGGRHEMVRPRHTSLDGVRRDGRLVSVVTTNGPSTVRAWLDAHPSKPGINIRSLESLEAMVLWHEVGHAILDETSEDHWTRHAAEIWCDALGAAAALAATGDASGPRIAHFMHGDAAVERLWHGKPWTNELPALLAIASEASKPLIPEPSEDRVALARLVRAQQLQGRRCTVAINDRFAAFDLGSVVEKAPSPDELNGEVAQHRERGRRMVKPRGDLPGGRTALDAWLRANQADRTRTVPDRAAARATNPRLDNLGRVLAHLRPEDGWRCRNLTDTKVVMEHPVHGRRVCIVCAEKVAIRGGVPDRPATT